MQFGVRDYSTVGSLRTQPTSPVSHPYFRRSAAGLLSASIGFGEQARLPPPQTEATKRGVRFEEKVVRSLTRSYPSFVSGLPFYFQTCTKRGKAIPDGLLFSEEWKALLVVEVKLRHCGDAWQQLVQFYLPIVSESLRGVVRAVPLEICKYYDPQVKLPKPTAFVGSLEEALSVRTEAYLPVLIWSTRDQERGGQECLMVG